MSDQPFHKPEVDAAILAVEKFAQEREWFPGDCEAVVVIAIRAYEATKAENFNWQAAYRKAHADLCHVEAENYVLRKQVEARKAPAVPDEVRQCIAAMKSMAPHPQHWCSLAAGLLERAYSRAVPEEVAEVVRQLRGHVIESMDGNSRHPVKCCLRAADLLERLSNVE